MGISIFPSTAAEFVSNNFVVDMNDTTNNTVTLQNVKQAGTYNIAIESGDTSFDIYLLDSDGALVAYTNTTTVAAPGLFQIVVILGVADSEVVSFSYAGTVNNTDGEGDQPGAGAYLESISPADLPSIDDTATVIGGNFGTATEIKFESGTVSLDAKNITVTNGTSLVVTRPDNLDASLDPWDLRAITTGVAQPTGTNANILNNAVTAGAVPTWVTTSPLTQGTINQAYTDTLEATDADGDVTYSITSGSLPTGLSLNSSTGVISGTPTAGGQTFTAAATDDGGNQNTREFTIPIQAATGGTITSSGGFIYHTFTSTDDFVALADLPTAEYLVVAGGGGGNDGNGGAGGAGGLLNSSASITAGTYTATVGAGGAASTQGSNSTFGAFATAIGGGVGGAFDANGGTGGSGGGAGRATSGASGGSGTAGQGNDGGDSPSNQVGGGGGGAGQIGGNGLPFPDDTGGDGGNGLQFSDWATATSTGADGGYYAGGGGAYGSGGNGNFGLGGGGGDDGSIREAIANTGGGGGGNDIDVGNGGSGIIIVRYS